MNNKQWNKLKTRLSKFLEDIDHIYPDEVSVEDIDEWIGFTRSIRRKVKQVSN